LIHCPDKKGIVASVTDFIFKNQGNILDLDQHVDLENEVFFMRVEWDLQTFKLKREEIIPSFELAVGQKYSMKFSLNYSDDVPRVAIFVSKLSHCLFDILSRQQSGEWKVEVPLIVSNHKDLEPVAKKFGIDFHYFPIDTKNKKEQEKKQLALLKEKGIEFIVLARYMQIVTKQLIDAFPNRIINIHHSFLPAFPGSKPYHSAYERGVKVIGATSHYVTEDLDQGPIITQDVTAVSHKDSVADLIRKGQDLEKLVLSRAVFHHLRREVLVHDNRTINFA